MKLKKNMAPKSLEDEELLSLVPEFEKQKMRVFQEQYCQFRKTWDDYIKKINAYRKSKKD